MDQAKMVEAELSKRLIDAGAALVQRLDEKGLKPDAAFWLYSTDSQSWRLILAESKVGRAGPKDVYRQIQRIIKEQPEETRILNLSDIGLLGSDAPLIQLMRTAIRTGDEITGIRFTNNVVNGNLIDDAYIYRVA